MITTAPRTMCLGTSTVDAHPSKTTSTSPPGAASGECKKSTSCSYYAGGEGAASAFAAAIAHNSHTAYRGADVVNSQPAPTSPPFLPILRIHGRNCCPVLPGREGAAREGTRIAERLASPQRRKAKVRGEPAGGEQGCQAHLSRQALPSRSFLEAPPAGGTAVEPAGLVATPRRLGSDRPARPSDHEKSRTCREGFSSTWKKDQTVFFALIVCLHCARVLDKNSQQVRMVWHVALARSTPHHAVSLPILRSRGRMSTAGSRGPWTTLQGGGRCDRLAPPHSPPSTVFLIYARRPGLSGSCVPLARTFPGLQSKLQPYG